jgi:hypothetical protein
MGCRGSSSSPSLGSASRRADSRISYYDVGVEFHTSAFKHGVDESSIVHAVEHALVIVDLDAESDPPKVLAIGPDAAGNLLEIIWLELENSSIVIHAMALRRSFYDLLPEEREPLP